MTDTELAQALRADSPERKRLRNITARIVHLSHDPGTRRKYPKKMGETLKRSDYDFLVKCLTALIGRRSGA